MTETTVAIAENEIRARLVAVGQEHLLCFADGLSPGDRAALELDEERSALVSVILNRGEGGGLTVNLQGPLVINTLNRIGEQLVLADKRWETRHKLMVVAQDTQRATA